MTTTPTFDSVRLAPVELVAGAPVELVAATPHGEASTSGHVAHVLDDDRVIVDLVYISDEAARAAFPKRCERGRSPSASHTCCAASATPAPAGSPR